MQQWAMGISVREPPVALEAYALLGAVPGLTLRDIVDGDPLLIEQLRQVVSAVQKVNEAKP